MKLLTHIDVSRSGFVPSGMFIAQSKEIHCVAISTTNWWEIASFEDSELGNVAEKELHHNADKSRIDHRGN